LSHWLDTVVTLLCADTSDLRELAKIAGRDPKTFYIGVDFAKLEISDQDLRGIGLSNFATHRLSKIRDTRRAEERVTLLLDSILYNQKDGLEALSDYEASRTIREDHLVDILRRLLENSPGFTRTSRVIDRFFRGRNYSDEQMKAVLLVDAVRQLYSRALPTSRDALFYNMAKHLSKYPEIKEYLIDKYRRASPHAFRHVSRIASHMRYDYRESIETYLLE
jgi:hypothetical protein